MAADFIAFAEGENVILSTGLPSTLYFLLSSSAVGTLVPTNKLSTGVGEITGTTYARQSQAEPAPVSGLITFTTMTWTNGPNLNWVSPRAVVMASTADNTGVAFCAWNIVPGGAAWPMSAANAAVVFQPVLAATS
jgi:hypothetical protein